MEQREFNATQRINDACYDLIRDGYSIKQVYNALSTVMDAVKPKHRPTLDLPTELEQSIRRAQGMYNAMDN